MRSPATPLPPAPPRLGWSPIVKPLPSSGVRRPRERQGVNGSAQNLERHPASRSSGVDGERDQSVVPIRTLWKTSSLTKNPTKINSKPMNSPSKTDHYTHKLSGTLG